jgi:hypothetical protein
MFPAFIMEGRKGMEECQQVQDRCAREHHVNGADDIKTKGELRARKDANAAFTCSEASTVCRRVNACLSTE